MAMQVFVLFGTIFGALYFLLFEPDSPIAVTLMALTPLGWLGLFAIRFFSEKKKVSSAQEDDGELSAAKKRAKDFVDPDELVKNKRGM